MSNPIKFKLPARKEFKAWLDSLQEDDSTGISQDSEGCPLANFINEKLKANGIEGYCKVYGEEIEVFDDKDRTIKEFWAPKWMQRFQELVDEISLFDITAKQAKSFLNNRR